MIPPQNETTLGLEIFRSRHISNIRNQLERKALTCVLIGGSRHDHLPAPIQIDNKLLRGVYYLARIVKKPKDLLLLDGETGDIARHCYRDGIPPILTESPTPIFGEDDLRLLGLIDQIETLEEKAMKGEILL
jgi:hypothetical protein